MLRKLAVTVTAVVGLGIASSTGAIAAHGGGGGGGGGGHGGGGGGFGGGHGGFGGGGFGGGHGGFNGGFNGGPGGFPGRGAFVNRGGTSQFTGGQLHAGRGVAANSFAARHVTNGGRFAWSGHHRFRGRRIYGFIPGYGYGDYWYYGDCSVWTDYGWVNMCDDGYPY
jgi:hypothetical protein